jgi:hypothetical protein
MRKSGTFRGFSGAINNVMPGYYGWKCMSVFTDEVRPLSSDNPRK